MLRTPSSNTRAHRTTTKPSSRSVSSRPQTARQSGVQATAADRTCCRSPREDRRCVEGRARPPSDGIRQLNLDLENLEKHCFFQLGYISHNIRAMAVKAGVISCDLWIIEATFCHEYLRACSARDVNVSSRDATGDHLHVCGKREEREMGSASE